MCIPRAGKFWQLNMHSINILQVAE
jgi:hypothetical protein